MLEPVRSGDYQQAGATQPGTCEHSSTGYSSDAAEAARRGSWSTTLLGIAAAILHCLVTAVTAGSSSSA